MSKAVYYAITNTQPYLNMAKISIRSLRKYNSSMPVHLFVFGKLPEKEKLSLGSQVSLWEMPPIGSLFPLLVKYRPLKYLKEDRLLFCDADTEFFGDVESFFRRYQDADFYARREIGSYKKAHWIGSLKQQQVNHKILRQIYDEVGGRHCPLFNTGLMLFNNRSYKKIRWHILQRFYQGIVRGEWPYPSPNHFLREEFAFAYALSVTDIKWGSFRKESAPFFLELKQGVVSSPGVMTHVMTGFYKEYRKFKQTLFI